MRLQRLTAGVLLVLIGGHAGAQAPGAARRAGPAPQAGPSAQAARSPGLPPEVGAASPARLLHEDQDGRADRLLLSLAGQPGVGFAAAWSDLRHGTPVVYVRRFGRAGDALGEERAVRESYSAVIELDSSLALGPEGHSVAVWELEEDPAGERAFRLRQLAPDGHFLDSDQTISSKKGWMRTRKSGADAQRGSAESTGLLPRAVVDGRGQVHVVWNYEGHVLLQELGQELRLLDAEGPAARGRVRLIGRHAGPALAVWKTSEGIRSLALQGPDAAPSPCGSGSLLGAVEDLRPGQGFWLLLNTGEQAVLRPLDGLGRVSGADVALLDAPLGYLDLASWSQGLALVRQERTGKPLEGIPGGPLRLHLYSADGSTSLRPPMIVSAPEAKMLAPRVVGGGDRLLTAWSEQRDGGFEVYGRILRADGLDFEAEFPLATAQATANQSHPAGASVQDRRAVAVWEDERTGHARVQGRMITAAGDPMGVEFSVPVRLSGAPYDVGAIRAPAVAMGPAGDFAVAWLQGNQLSCQVFEADVRPVGAAGVVTEDLDLDRGFALVRQERYRSWLFAWVDRAGGGVLVQRVRADGVPLAEPTAVSGPGTVAHPALLELADGRVLVAWDLTEGGSAKLRARLLEAELQASSEVLVVPLPPRGSHSGPLLAPAPEGGFLMAWSAELSQTETLVVARQFDRRGEPRGDLQSLSQPAGKAGGLSLASLRDGSWVLGWEVTDLQGTRIVVRRLAPGASQPGPARLLDPPASGYREGSFAPVLLGVDRGWLGIWVDAHRGAGLDVWCRAVGNDFDLSGR